MNFETSLRKLYDGNWNRTSQGAHVARLYLSWRLGRFPDDVAKDERNSYNRDFLENASQLLNKHPFDEKEQGWGKSYLEHWMASDPGINWPNIEKLFKWGLYDQIARYHYPADDIVALHVLRGTKVYQVLEISNTNEEIRYYPIRPDGIQYVFATLERAMIYLMCPDYWQAVVKLADL